MAGIWLATAVMAVALTALGILVLRYGPHRGDWNNPAAVFRPPSRNVRRALIALALLTVSFGIAGAFAAPDQRLALIIVSIASAAMYVAMAYSTWIARRAIRRRAASHAVQDAPGASQGPPTDHTA